MFVMFQIAALFLAADKAPSYTVHVRELTAPEQVVRVPLAGSVSIFDAVGALKQPPRELAGMDLWIVRRAEDGKVKVLRVDWDAITQHGETATNYVMLPGDRLFLQARPAERPSRKPFIGQASLLPSLFFGACDSARASPARLLDGL
jgi:hypothetical protein